ncbi:hypothetical protein [Ornithinibacillus bavariensis]|uniref:hypothetical protein n=1 Tax=Ornithinibacillus bavariensis TaxID=545502 RepID=UPI003D248575
MQESNKSRARLLAEQAEQVRIKSEELLNRSEDHGDTREDKETSTPGEDSDLR